MTKFFKLYVFGLLVLCLAPLAPASVPNQQAFDVVASAQESEDLVVKRAEENGGWGYKRISGELKKLGHVASPGYVRDVLKRHGIPPAA